ncbi:MAG: hypothetical protein LBF91_01080, partial [Azoarcus sp.]|nr:hypothetical protein [Azoarcus sp.]
LDRGNFSGTGKTAELDLGTPIAQKVINRYFNVNNQQVVNSRHYDVIFALKVTAGKCLPILRVRRRFQTQRFRFTGRTA